MSQQSVVAAPQPTQPLNWKRFFSLDNRYIAPMFITCILIAGHLSFGILESYRKTGIAILASIVTELLLGRIFMGKWPNIASAYITGISVGILVRSPAFWPYVLCSVISIMSKYVLRAKGRHIWNPSNFGISVLLFLAPATVAGLSIQWGNYLLAHDRGLDSWLYHHIAPASFSYHRHVRRVLHRVRVPAQFPHRQSLAIGNRASDRSHVSTFYFFHDHGP